MKTNKTNEQFHLNLSPPCFIGAQNPYILTLLLLLLSTPKHSPTEGGQQASFKAKQHLQDKHRESYYTKNTRSFELVINMVKN